MIRIPAWRRLLPLLLLLPVVGAAAHETRAWGDPAARVDFYRRKLQADPRHVVARARLADALLDRHQHAGRWTDLRDADRECRRSLGLAPTFDGFLTAARISGYRHHFRESLRWADQALDTLPNEPRSASLAVSALLELGRYDEARERAEEALRVRQDGLAWMDAARVFWTTGDATAGRKALGRARDWTLSQPRMAALAAWTDAEEARWWLAAGRFREAEGRFRSALARVPGDRAAMVGLADTALAAGRTHEAIRRYRELLRHRDDPDLHGDLSLAYRKLGLKRDSDRELRWALAAWNAERARGETSPLRHMAQLYLDSERDAPRALALALAETRERGGIYMDALVARALAANRRWKEAWAPAERSVRYSTPDLDLLRTAAEIAEKAGKPAAGKSLRERARLLAAH